MVCARCKKNPAKIDHIFGAMWCDECNASKKPIKRIPSMGSNRAQAVFEDDRGKKYAVNEKGNVLSDPKFYTKKSKRRTFI